MLHPMADMWNGFVHTNIQGGDPSVLQVSTNIYLMVYVGPPNSTGLEEAVPEEGLTIVYPNPARDFLHLFSSDNLQEYDYGIFRLNGQLVHNGHSNQNSVDLGKIPSGVYLLNVRTKYNSQYFKFFKN
jgi:hypothetical protein